MICSIIGGGLSVKNAQGFIGYRIGVNHTYKYIDVDCTCGMDKEIGEDKTIPNLHNLSHHKNSNALKSWIVEGFNFNREPNKVLQFNNSTVFAINVAIQLGYKTIYVLGADNRLTYPSHFYKHRTLTPQDKEFYELMFKSIDKRLSQLTLKDERLIFVDSEIKHFENITMDEYNEIVKKSL